MFLYNTSFMCRYLCFSKSIFPPCRTFSASFDAETCPFPSWRNEFIMYFNRDQRNFSYYRDFRLTEVLREVLLYIIYSSTSRLWPTDDAKYVQSKLILRLKHNSNCEPMNFIIFPRFRYLLYKVWRNLRWRCFGSFVPLKFALILLNKII